MDHVENSEELWKHLKNLWRIPYAHTLQERKDVPVILQNTKKNWKEMKASLGKHSLTIENDHSIELSKNFCLYSQTSFGSPLALLLCSFHIRSHSWAFEKSSISTFVLSHLMLAISCSEMMNSTENFTTSFGVNFTLYNKKKRSRIKVVAHQPFIT